MHSRKLTSTVLAMGLIASAFALPSLPVPGRSPDFTISVPSGKATTLAAFRGKVVIMEFLFVKSQHCMRVASMLNELNDELGPRGLQAIGVALTHPARVPSTPTSAVKWCLTPWTR